MWLVGGDAGSAERRSAPGGAALSLIAELGCALLDAGAPTSTVGPGMHQLARRFGVDCEITVQCCPRGSCRSIPVRAGPVLSRRVESPCASIRRTGCST